MKFKIYCNAETRAESLEKNSKEIFWNLTFMDWIGIEDLIIYELEKNEYTLMSLSYEDKKCFFQPHGGCHFMVIGLNDSNETIQIESPCYVFYKKP